MTLDSNKTNDIEEGLEPESAAGADAPSTESHVAATAADDLPKSSTDQSPVSPAATVTKERAVTTGSSKKSNTPAKVIVAILLLVVIAGVLLFVQRDSSSAKTVKLTKHDMEFVFQEMLPPQAQQMIASNPEEKKKLVDQLKKILAVAQVAEREGYAQRPEIESQIAFQTDMSLNQAYRKKNPDMKVGEDQINAYYQAHPNDFDAFLQADPRRAQQAQGPRREDLKKQFGEFKVVADLARKEKLDQDDAIRLQVLIDRSQILRNAYLTDLDKNAEKLVSDAEIEQYYNDHKDEFEKVRVRHILIGTQAPPGGDPSKVLSKDEARKKAQSVLERAKKGEDFVKLVEENSDDPGSKSKGGEYEFARKSGMVQPFEDASFNLKPGEISDLVETDFGFHIIKLEERRVAQATEQDTRQEIIEKMKQEKIEARINEIAQASSVEVPEDFDATPKPVEAQPMTGGGAPRPGATPAPNERQ
jgi:hypothetical protein